MISIVDYEVLGLKWAIKAMRVPYESFERSDSTDIHLGHNDIDLGNRLYISGTEHRKYLRFITVYLDIIAPRYRWLNLTLIESEWTCHPHLLCIS